ncbi:MAG: serine hydrolase [Bryobacter sp.]|nr:serine hydrolase [Bryobacter sp.]
MVILRTFLALSLTVAAFGQDLAAKADPFFTELARQGKFSGVVLIAKDGKVEFAKGYGMADYEAKRPNTLETQFRIGSITKQFTAAAILQLAEKGKLKLSDSACQHLPRCADAWKPLTLHHLLSHTGGLANFTSLPGYAGIMNLPSEAHEQLKLVWEMPLEFTPGEKFEYSNTGYLLLGLVIEKVSGEPLGQYFTKHIFEPAGMRSTRLEGTNDNLPQRARGYRGNGGNPVPAQPIDMRIPGAAGAVVSTAPDLLAWDRALAANKVISAASRKLMLTEVKGGYGYGTSLRPFQGKATDGHNGGINGFVSLFTRFTDEGTAVVALANFEDIPGNEVMPGLMALAVGGSPEMPKERKEVSLEESVLEEYVGRYELTPDFSLSIRLEGKQLITQATKQPPIPVFAEAKDVLFPKLMPATLRIQRGADGKVTGLVLEQGGRQMPAKKVE